MQPCHDYSRHTLPSTRRKGIGATGNHATFGVKQIYAGGKFRAIHARRIYAVEIESGGPALRHCDQSPRPHGHVTVGIHGKHSHAVRHFFRQFVESAQAVVAIGVEQHVWEW